MLNTTVSYLLGMALAALAMLHVLPLLAASIAADWSLAGLFFASFVFTVFLAGAFIVAARGRLEPPSRMQFISLVIVVWVIVPAVAALPFYASNLLADPIQAYFETVSGLTTTGATVIRDIDALPKAMIIWRASLQWLGGLFSLLTVLLVLAPFGISGAPSSAHVPGYESGNLVKSARILCVSILPVYGALTAVCFFCLWASGLPGIDALCVSLSTLSTGGFMPRNGGFEVYQAPLAELVVMVFMIVGATSFLAHRAHFRRHYTGRHRDNPETAVLLIACGVLGIALAAVFAAKGVEGSRPDWLVTAGTALFQAVSLATTTGFTTNAELIPTVPFVIALAVCFVGGAAFSTAGGVKLFRAMLLLRQSMREIERLIHPHGISQARSTGRTINIQLMKSIWVLFFAYLFVAAALALLLSSDGLSFESALMAGVAALSNVGPALSISIPADAGLVVYADMSGFSLAVLAGGMVMGRIELLVLFSLANIAYWRS